MSEYTIEARHASGKVGIFKRMYKRNGKTKISIDNLDRSKAKVFPSKKRAELWVTKLTRLLGDEYQFEVVPLKKLTVFGEEEKEKSTVDGKWICGKNADLEIWNACEYYDLKSQAIRAAKNQIYAHNKGERKDEFEDVLGYYPDDADTIISFAVGQCSVSDIGIDVDNLLEQVSQDVYDQCGEVAEDYLDDVLDEHKKELENLILKWFERHDYLPGCYSIGNIETILVYEAEEDKLQ